MRKSTDSQAKASKPRKVGHQTEKGRYHIGDSLELLNGALGQELKGRVQLLFDLSSVSTQRQEELWQLTGDEHKVWFIGLAETFPRS